MGLVLRSLFWTVLFPGTVTVLVPWLFFMPADQHGLTRAWYTWLGLPLIITGASMLLWSIYAFARDGKGTLSPADPARRLVIRGLYQYVRNPMYVGVVGVLSGEAVFFASMPLFGYTAVVFLIFNLFIRVHEEPYLKREFGAAYEQYCREAGRWLPRFPRQGQKNNR